MDASPRRPLYTCPFEGDRIARAELIDRAVTHLMEDAIAEMIGWLRDCGCEDEQLVGRTNREIIREVQLTFDGGLPGFLSGMDWKPIDEARATRGPE